MKYSHAIFTAVSVLFSTGAHAADATGATASVGGNSATAATRWTLQLETGPVWFSRNNVRIPNDTGTRFDMLDLTGDGPVPYARLRATYDFNARHAVRLELAPLGVARPGGLPLMAGADVVGAIAASGSPSGQADEVCIRAGIAKIADRIK